MTSVYRYPEVKIFFFEYLRKNKNIFGNNLGYCSRSIFMQKRDFKNLKIQSRLLSILPSISSTPWLCNSRFIYNCPFVIKINKYTNLKIMFTHSFISLYCKRVCVIWRKCMKRLAQLLAFSEGCKKIKLCRKWICCRISQPGCSQKEIQKSWTDSSLKPKKKQRVEKKRKNWKDSLMTFLMLAFSSLNSSSCSF